MNIDYPVNAGLVSNAHPLETHCLLPTRPGAEQEHPVHKWGLLLAAWSHKIGHYIILWRIVPFYWPWK